MPQLSLGESVIHYSVSGSGAGTPLLCLHGGACRGSDFDQLGSAFEERRTIAIDQRGHGTSVECPGPFDPPTFAQDAAAILAQEGIDEVVIVGHSLGGPIALELLRSSTLNVKGLVSIDAPLVLAEPMAAGMTQLYQAYDAGMGAAAFRQFMSAVVGYAHDAEQASTLLENLCTAPDHVVGPLVRAVTEYDGTDILAAHEAPVLQIDAGFGVCDLARLAELRPDAWIAKTAGTGHYPHMESTAQVVAMMRHFFTSHDI